MSYRRIKSIISLVLMIALVIGACGFSAVDVDAATKIKTNDQRYSGYDRCATSLAVAKALYLKNGKFDNVIVASGEKFPDAMSGANLAKVKKGPMLLYSKLRESEIISTISKYMKPEGKIYILGGKNVVPTSFDNKVKSQGFEVQRLQGKTRYVTNLEILKESFKPGNSLIIASGKDYPDALSGSALGVPMMLVGDSLDSQQVSWLNGASINKIYILGGLKAVSQKVENQVKKYGTVTRISGSNRYDTSRKIASRFFANATTAVLVSGKAFPDGLSGAPLAMANKAPILLASEENYAYPKSYVVGKSITNSITIGGTTAMPKKLVASIMEQYKGGSKHVHIWRHSFAWDTNDSTKAKLYSKCLDCGAKTDKTVTATFKISKPATYDSDGQVTYTATAKDPDGVSRTITKTSKLQSLFHSYSYDWDEDRYNSGTKKLHVKAYAYVAGGYGASGRPAVVGTCAVDRSVIPMGTMLYIDGYGFARANDTGGNIIGNTVDLVMNSTGMCYSWGVRYVDVYILE